MKISKIILSLILGCAFAFSAFTFAACKVSGGEAAPSEQTPSGSNNQSGSNSGDTNNSGGNNNSQDGNKDDKTQEFSDILTNILDENHRNLWQKIYDNGFKISNDVKPIPYKFLRQQGHNVDAYLDGTLDAFASSYIYDDDKNHIYVSVKAENVSTSQYGNYYTNYVLKYPLTDQEYEEYTYLCEGEYVQGLFFIQELDNQKTPEIVNKINVQIETYNDMITKYSHYEELNQDANTIEIDIYTFNINEIEISIRNGSSSNMLKNHIGFIKLEPNKIMAGVETYDKSVMKLDDANWINYKNLEEYQSSLQNITSFGYGQQIKHTNPYGYYEVKSR